MSISYTRMPASSKTINCSPSVYFYSGSRQANLPSTSHAEGFLPSEIVAVHNPSNFQIWIWLTLLMRSIILSNSANSSSTEKDLAVFGQVCK